MSESDGGVSRHISNAHLGAGSFNDILGSDSDGGVSRHVSNAKYGAGTFDMLVTDEGTYSGAPTASLIALEDDGASEGGSEADALAPSRRASNMAGRAGTFDELMASGYFPGAAGGHSDTFGHLLDADASVTAGGVADKLLADTFGRLSTGRKLRADAQASRRFHQRSVSWRETSPQKVRTQADAIDNTDVPSDDDMGELSGAISRVATNMSAAAGHFDALVDEDGDELPPEEHSDAGGGYGDGLSGELDQLYASADSAMADSAAVATGPRTMAPSFAGMISDADVLRAAGGEPMHAHNASVGGVTAEGAFVFASVDLQPAARNSAQRGAASVRNIRGGNGAAAPGVTGAWGAQIAGALPSDEMASEDESGAQNPAGVSADQLPGAPADEPSGSALWEHETMATSQQCVSACDRPVLLLRSDICATMNHNILRHVHVHWAVAHCNTPIDTKCAAQLNQARSKHNKHGQRCRSRSAFSSLRLDEATSGAPSATSLAPLQSQLQTAGSYHALPPPTAGSMHPIKTPRGTLRTPTEYAVISFSGAPSRVASSVAADVAATGVQHCAISTTCQSCLTDGPLQLRLMTAAQLAAVLHPSVSSLSADCWQSACKAGLIQ